jgi:hypothetical protein
LDASGIQERPKPGRTVRKATGSSISTLFIHPLIAQPALTSLTPGNHPRFAGAAGQVEVLNVTTLLMRLEPEEQQQTDADENSLMLGLLLWLPPMATTTCRWYS